MKILNKNNILLSVKNYKKQTKKKTNIFPRKILFDDSHLFLFFPDSLQKFYDA